MTKLKLNKETILSLNPAETGQVDGAINLNTMYCIPPTRFFCATHDLRCNFSNQFPQYCS